MRSGMSMQRSCASRDHEHGLADGTAAVAAPVGLDDAVEGPRQLGHQRRRKLALVDERRDPIEDRALALALDAEQHAAEDELEDERAADREQAAEIDGLGHRQDAADLA